MDVHPVPLCRMRVLGTVFTCASRWWAQSYSVPVFQKGNFFDHRQVVPAGDGGQPRAMPRRRVCWMILARHTTRGYLPSRSQTHPPQYTSDKGRVLAISVSYTRKLQYAALGDAEFRSCPASICRESVHTIH